MDEEIDARRWSPVRAGATYCSPACGNGCTWADYGKAVLAAASLATELGDGWEPEVWENLGWHYRVKKGCFYMSVVDGMHRMQADLPGRTLFAQAISPHATVLLMLNELHNFATQIKEAIEQL